MKLILKLMIILLAAGLISACSNKKIFTRDAFKRAFYQGLMDANDIKDPEPLKPPHKEPPSYQQYMIDRRDMVRDTDGVEGTEKK